MSKKEVILPPQPPRPWVDFSLLLGAIASLGRWLRGLITPVLVVTALGGVVYGVGYLIWYQEKYGFIQNYKWYAVNGRGVEYELFSPPKVEDFIGLQGGKCVSKSSFALIMKPGESAVGPFYYLIGYRFYDQHREDRNQSQKYFLCFSDQATLERKQ